MPKVSPVGRFSKFHIHESGSTAHSSASDRHQSCSIIIYIGFQKNMGKTGYLLTIDKTFKCNHAQKEV